MPSKTQTTSKPKGASKSERLRLAESICNFTKKQEAFLLAYDDLKEYNHAIFKDLDLQIDTKQLELNELSKKYKNQETDLKIECDQMIKKYRYEEAIKILAEKEEEPISSSELEKLRNELNNLKEDFDVNVADLIATEKKLSVKAISIAISNTNLKHAADIAEIKALSKQKENEVTVLYKTIESYKFEIAEQRKLTQSVAEAGKQGAISQNFGKQ
jgi:hypothetical protein